VLRLYQRLQALQAQLLEATDDVSDLDLLGRLMLRTSARNQLQGQVSALHRVGWHDRVGLALSGGLQIEALITHDSTERLGLALLKAGWVRLLGHSDEADQQHNCLQVTVDSILTGTDGPHEVRLALGNGQTLCAFAEPAWLAEHQVTVGSALRAQFSAADVVIGIPA